jgi:hypothetical protein
VAEVAMYQIFNCFVVPVTAANRIVAIAKNTIIELGLIVAMAVCQKTMLHLLLGNVWAQLKKGVDVRKKQKIQVVFAIFINK